MFEGRVEICQAKMVEQKINKSGKPPRVRVASWSKRNGELVLGDRKDDRVKLFCGTEFTEGILNII